MARFYAAWAGAAARLKVRDYAHDFEQQLEKRIGRRHMEEEYTARRDEWRAQLFVLKLDQQGREDRRAAEAGRLEDLLRAARACDPRLPREEAAAAAAEEEDNPRVGKK